MRFWHGLAFLPTEHAVELARVSDAAGYHGIAISDHVFTPEVRRSKYPYSADGSPIWPPDTAWPDPWVLIGAMAAVTQRLRFTTNVYVAPARDLFTVAKLVATAAVVAGGRVALGAGAGWCEEEFEQLGQDFATRGRRFDEMIGALRSLWTGDPVEHHGSHYDFDALRIAPVPDGPIPVYVGGDSPAALRRAARLGDGWIGNAYTEDELTERLIALHDQRVAAGRADEPFEVILAVKARPTPDACRRWEEAGVTGLLCAPALRAGTSLDERIEATERFAEEVVLPAQGAQGAGSSGATSSPNA